MKIMTEAEKSSLGEIILVSNTPQFLFRRLRENYTVRKIAERFTTKQIIQDLRKWGKTLKSADEPEAMVYAHLVALSFKDLGEYQREVESLAFPIRWFPHIKEMVLRSDIDSSHTYPLSEETFPNQKRSGKKGKASWISLGHHPTVGGQ